MAGRYRSKLNWSDVTPESVWLNRRQLIVGAGAIAAGAAAGGAMAETLKPNTWDEITSYNNYYEFGTDKADPKRHAHRLTTDPWSIVIDGLVERPGTYDLADVMTDRRSRSGSTASAASRPGRW
jgi:methionine sulfoxide reductase catalytic subunit